MNDLAEFFRKKKESVAQLELNNNKEEMLQEWLDALQKLFDQFRRWLEPAVNEGLVVKLYHKEIAEEDLGTYQAPALEVSFGLRRVRIEPIARLIIGGAGRVDVDSWRGIFKFIRSVPQGEWYLVRKGLAEAEPLEERVFTNLIKEIFA